MSDDEDDGGFIVTVFVKCPECGTDVLAMVGPDGFAEEVKACAEHQ